MATLLGAAGAVAALLAVLVPLLLARIPGRAGCGLLPACLR